MRYLSFLFTTLLVGCPNGSYNPNYANATNYVVEKSQGTRTSGGVLVVALKDRNEILFAAIDRSVDELDVCLAKLGRKKVQRRWFGVLVPIDWYVSSCSGEQLVPSKANPALCEAKGLTIPEQCRWVAKPSSECPCPCNFRAVIQDDWWIVTAPNLKLFKAELLRLVTSVNNVWANETLRTCLQ